MRFYVKVLPGSSGNELIKISEGEYAAKVSARAEKGRANAALLKILADYFGVSQSEVSLIVGKTSRKKLVEINE